MTVKDAITALQHLPQDGQLMVCSLGHGGSVPLQGFEDVDRSNHNEQPHWIDVVACENHERPEYGLKLPTDLLVV